MVKDSFCLFQSNLSSHCPFVLASIAPQSLRDWAGLDWTELSWAGLGWAGRGRYLDSSFGSRTSWKKETPKGPQACLQRPPPPLTPLPWARAFMMTQLLQSNNILTLAGMMTMKAFFLFFFFVFFTKISPLTWTTSLFRWSTMAPSSITSPLHVSRNLLLLLRWSIGSERRPSCGSRERHSLSVFPVGNSRRFPASHWIGPLSVRGLTPSTVRLLWLSVCWIAVILAARISSNRGRKRDPHHDEEWGFAAL